MMEFSLVSSKEWDHLIMKRVSHIISIVFLLLVMSLSHSLLVCQSTPEDLRYESTEQEVTMSLLHIALQDGFADDEVIVKVNGEEVFNKSRVRTRFQIGLADSFEINVKEGAVNVEVKLPLKNLSKSITLKVSGSTYLGVSITTEGEINFHISNERFRYM